MPISIGAFVLSEPIIRTLFERGQFDSSATLVTSRVLSFYAIGMLASGIIDVVIRVFYSLQDTKTPMKNSLLCVFLNIIFNLILVRFLKAPGLALGSSLSSIFAVTFLMYNLRKKIGRLHAKNMIITFFKTLFASGIMATVVLFTFDKISQTNEIIALLISTSIGAIVYVIIIIQLKIDATDYILDVVKSRFYKKER